MTDKTVVIYHAECADGFGAAWAAWKKLGDSAVYLPMHNRLAPPEIVEGAHVYTLDYSFSEADVRAWAPKAKSWTIVDHHGTNAAAVVHATDSLYDLSHSGAVLAWSYFHPNTPIPKLLSYIEDADMWWWKLPHSRAISESLGLKDVQFGEWDRIARDLEDPQLFDAYREEGELLARAATREVEKIAPNAEEVIFEGIKTLAVNSPVHTSELGHVLYNKLPPMAIVWSRRGDRVIVSLRSDGSVDVSKMAQKYGGGGHPAAAAFSWEAKDFFKNVINQS